MHHPNASAYYADSGTALKSVGSKLRVFCGSVVTSHKTWKLAIEKIHLDLNNLKLATQKIHLDLNNLTHFHNSCGDKLDHTVY